MSEKIARLRISLMDTEPEIWRVVEVPLASSLAALHLVIQAAIGWEESHLYEFEADGQRYGLPEPGWGDLEAAKDAKLGVLAERGVSELLYIYDMGDSWEHLITIEAIEPVTPDSVYPRLIAGARRGPPEDIGGFPGYENFLEAIADPNHEEHDELMEWYGGPYDAADIDEPRIHRRLGLLVGRRTTGTAAATQTRNPR